MTFDRSSSAVCDTVAEEDPLPPHDGVPPCNALELADLYRAERPRLLRWFRRRADSVDASDLVNEVFVNFARQSDKATEVRQPEAYITRIATNLLRDRARAAVRRAEAYHQVFDDDRLSGVDPIEELETRDALRRLESAVQSLRPRAREIFLLQRAEGLSYAQIAERTGLSIKGVKKQMAKALFQLRRGFGTS